MDQKTLVRKAMMRGRAQMWVFLMWGLASVVLLRFHYTEQIIAATSVWAAGFIITAPFVLWFVLQEWYFRWRPLR